MIPASFFLVPATNRDLKYATNTGDGVVRLHTLDSAGDVGYCPSIAIDITGFHISYHDQTSGDLKYVMKYVTNRGDSTWIFYRLDTDEHVGACTSIAVDQVTGEVHISYWAETDRDLKYAYDTEVIPEFSSPVVVVGTTVVMAAVCFALNRREKGG
ncbi:MAG: hypothetical protein JW880_00950 [Candidatus Thermoplasmatota archaeon]|nr:hypothetical protein [Candidatus Thermoplasmatota archaeon]